MMIRMFRADDMMSGLVGIQAFAVGDSQFRIELTDGKAVTRVDLDVVNVHELRQFLNDFLAKHARTGPEEPSPAEVAAATTPAPPDEEQFSVTDRDGDVATLKPAHRLLKPAHHLPAGRHGELFLSLSPRNIIGVNLDRDAQLRLSIYLQRRLGLSPAVPVNAAQAPQPRVAQKPDAVYKASDRDGDGITVSRLYDGDPRFRINVVHHGNHDVAAMTLNQWDARLLVAYLQGHLGA